MIEHIRPRTKKKYPELTYIFCNLSVACKKYIDIDNKKEDIDFCEDRKDDKYDESKFLNPHELISIEDYFEYDIEGKIFARYNDDRANYMIKNVLKLNHDVLNGMRENQYLIFSEMDIDEVESILLDDDVEELPPFYSMLKFLILK